MSRTRRVVAMAALVVLTMVLPGCGDDSEKASNHNTQDVNFVNGMIPHHAQAVEMAKLAATHASNTQVKELARAIQSAQQPEIDKMNSWLKSWGEPIIDPVASLNAEHAEHGVQGMLSTDEMKALQLANGAAFDRAFVNGMIKHHEGAIAMSKTEQEKGLFPDAKALAGRIISSQQAEIDQMKKLSL